MNLRNTNKLTLAIALGAIGIGSAGTVTYLSSAQGKPYLTYVDVPYGNASNQQTFTAYVPKVRSGQGITFFFHGHGRPSNLSQSSKLLRLPSQDNITLISCDYRQPDSVAFPAAVEDAWSCIRQARRVLGSYNVPIDTSRYVCFGGSFGGFLCDLINSTCNDSSLGWQIGDTCSSGLVSFAGGADLTRWTQSFLDVGCAPQTLNYGASPAELRWASPIYHTNSALSPAYLVHGLVDCTVPHVQSRWLDSAYRANGLNVTLALYAGFGHTQTMQADSIMNPALDFVKEILK